MDPKTSGRTARQLEILHALGYFAPEVDAEVAALGVRSGRGTYFASRSAAMGAVGPGVVTATFYVFNPTLVAKFVPAVWGAASPEDVVAARLRGITAAYERTMGRDAMQSEAVVEAAGLVSTAAEACAPEGRTLYAAHADLEWPTEPHLALWHGLTLLREYRGDGHIIALQQAGLSGIESLITHTATGRGFTVPAAQATRAWSEEQWTAAIDGLAERGLMTTDGDLTDAGNALRREVEDATNELARAPWDHLGEAGTARLGELGLPLVKKALEGGAVPDGVFA